jgi:hypothetical protein
MRKRSLSKGLRFKKAIRLDNRPLRMDRIPDVSNGILALPIENPEQLKRDMKAFIDKQKHVSRI